MEVNVKSSVHAEKAMKLFLSGYNCAQSVFAAFCDLHGMEEKEALRLSSSFGGGMGRLREVCGALSGIFMTAGLLWGYDSPEDKEAKTEHYRRIQELAKEFKSRTGSLVCRDLLGTLEQGKDSYIPSDRTEAYYQSRPCKELVGLAAAILDGYLEEIRKEVSD
ncbi:MAG: C-GCAxxG-C-C family protein [Clostridium sp.]|nr:C-GCAxxG-C-C family protein [Clostridium sp.]